MKLGKPDRRLMSTTIFRWTGAKSSRVVKGPEQGVDTSVLGVGHGQVVILSTDPVSIIPSLGLQKSAWLSVHGVASDVATSGVAPRFAMFDLNLPPSLPDSDLRKYWQHIHVTCREIGISILGGHTGRFAGCDYTVVGSATFFAMGEKGAFVTSDMAREGDDLIATKGAAVEATGVLANCFPKTVARRLGGFVLKNAKRRFWDTSIVKDAEVAASIGLGPAAVSAMHDVTEGGVLSAVLEMADASGLKAELDLDAILVADEVAEVCRLFRLDPLYALGQGCLIISANRERSEDIMRALQRRGIQASIIGKLSRANRHTIKTSSGTHRKLSYRSEDPYWRAFWKASQRGWS